MQTIKKDKAVFFFRLFPICFINRVAIVFGIAHKNNRPVLHPPLLLFRLPNVIYLFMPVDEPWYTVFSLNKIT